MSGVKPVRLPMPSLTPGGGLAGKKAARRTPARLSCFRTLIPKPSSPHFPDDLVIWRPSARILV